MSAPASGGPRRILVGPRERGTSGAPIEPIAGGPNGPIRTVAILGNHLPRHCGIATFTTDLRDALAGLSPELDCSVVAMNDVGKRYAYPDAVRFEIAAGDLASYRRAADFLNVGPADVLSVQHEYGIFGGRAGAHVLALLREIRLPVVTTLHTILADPNPQQRVVMDELLGLSDRLVVMSANGAELLRQVHGVAPSKIDVIPHGIPALPASKGSKRKLGLEGRRVVLTFGLLSPDKGIEYVIDALPAILRSCPNALYVVVGATHPHVKEEHGEIYRLSLEGRARRLGVESSIVFHDRFVSQAELVEFLSAADVYVTPYLKEEQITSGTLAYAVGNGKAVVSTPYNYARELLADGRGALVPWRDSGALAREIVDLLGDDGRRASLEARAAEHGRAMAWPIVARGYVGSFARARDERMGRAHAAFRGTLKERPPELPEIDLAHLRVMTDDTGLLQHAAYGIPRYGDGYCTDDNARALLLMALVEESGTEPPRDVRPLASRYLAFVAHAFDAGRGRFRNFMSYGRAWAETRGSEDSHGRALWGLGTVVGRSSDASAVGLARSLFRDALPEVPAFTSPRAWAYALLGVDEYLRAFEGDSGVESIRDALAGRLFRLYRDVATDDWPWFEDRLTYCNARLSQALVASGARARDAAMLDAGLRSLAWLVALQTSADGYFAPVGSNGFYVRGGTRAEFDQQPVEVHATISACLAAHRATRHPSWYDHARRQFHWFLGQNQIRTPLYDPSTGGCRDGLHPDRVNENQGAESTLSFLTSLAELRLADLGRQP